MSVNKRTWITRNGETNEKFVVRYTGQDGRRHLQTFKRKKEAEAYHDTVRTDVRKGTHIAPSSSITVTEAADNWLKQVEAEGRERTTVRQYRQHVNLHIVPRIGALKLAHLNPKRVETFRDSLLSGDARHAQLSRVMARKVLTSLKSTLKANGHMHAAEGVSVGRDKRRKRKIEAGVDFPTPAEVKRIIENAKKPRHAALLYTVALTGLRASEMRGLRWSDIDFDSKREELHVRQRADRYKTIGAPKSASSSRTVPLAPEAIKALKAWKLPCPISEGNLVFPTAKGQVEDHKSMLRSLAPIMRAAHVTTPARGADGKPRHDKKGRPVLEPKYALHAFRHFFASWCINPVDRGGRGLQPKEVQTLMGHSSIVITLDIYGHIFPRGDDRKELAASSRKLFA